MDRQHRCYKANVNISRVIQKVLKGATHVTGGANEFYFAIGYEPVVNWPVWKKNQVTGISDFIITRIL